METLESSGDPDPSVVVQDGDESGPESGDVGRAVQGKRWSSEWSDVMSQVSVGGVDSDRVAPGIRDE